MGEGPGRATRPWARGWNATPVDQPASGSKAARARPNGLGMTASTTHRSGDDEDALVRRGLPLVQYLVSDVAARVPRSVHREDLVSAGMLGLAQAARSWDAERGVAFESFARTRINGAILDELRGRDWASRSVRADARKLRDATEALTTSLGRAPHTDEVANRLGIEPDAVRRLENDVNRAAVLSYDAVFADPDGPGSPPATAESPTDHLLSRELRAVLGDAVASLPERLRKVVIEYFFDERPMQDIADDLGVTESRISQMRAEALALLRDGVNSQLDPDEVEDLGVDHGRVGRRKAAYYAAIADASTAQDRIAADEPLPQRVAAIVARSA
jgi:RNA polymerase sigma factor for flagellar operon FliA